MTRANLLDMHLNYVWEVLRVKGTVGQGDLRSVCGHDGLVYATNTTNNRASVTECSLQLSAATCVKVGRAWGIPLDEDGLLHVGSGSEQVDVY